MASRKRTIWTRAAVAATLMIGLPSLAGAQFGGRGPEYTPADDARDLKSVLFNWAWHMGMLRSTEEYDLIMTLMYQGEGTMQVDGAACNVSMYRSDISYRDSGERIRITGTRPGGQDCSTIQVLSGAYTWNEDVMGAELVPGEGTATPMPATVEDRMIRLWAGPQGAWKAAMAGTQYPDAPDLTGRPAQLPDDEMEIGRTSVRWVDGQPVVTFPIPGVPEAMATATLDDRFMPVSVVVENGRDTYEFTYSDYRDWNNPLHPAEAFFAGTMKEVKNGTVVRDITTTMTETGQMYVVMPVPASVSAAITPTHRPLDWTLTDRDGNPAGYDAPAPQIVADVPTPRRADGKPDLTGSWGRAPNPITGSGSRRCGPTQLPGGGINGDLGCQSGGDNFYIDYAWISPSRFGILGLPTYKPEHWDRIQELDMWTNKYDPIMTCKPIGIPRHGTPQRIVQTDYDVIMFYGANADYGGGNNEYRDVPIDGRELTDQQLNLSAFYGQSVGHWEGDTLVIESINFDDSTWFGRGGFFHSGRMRTVEKFTRIGDTLLYDMTVEDPEVLLEPWVMPTRVLQLSDNNRVQPERANCEVYEEGNETSQVRH
jgi:hypothetical protein